MAELHKANAAKNSEAQQVALSAEMQAKEELRLALERQQVQSKQDQEALVTQVKYEYNIVFQTAKTKNIAPLSNDWLKFIFSPYLIFFWTIDWRSEIKYNQNGKGKWQTRRCFAARNIRSAAGKYMKSVLRKEY